MELIKKANLGHQLVWTMVIIVLLVLITAMTQTGWLSYRSQRTRLIEQVASLKSLIESSGRFDAAPFGEDRGSEGIGATLRRVVDAFGALPDETRSELVFGERRGEEVYFLVAVHGDDVVGERHDDGPYGLGTPEYALSLEGPTGLPMKKAVTGESGTVVARDYRDAWVLAAFTPVEIAGKRFGLVAKLDASVVWGPVVSTAVLAALIACALIGIGIWRLLRLINPIIRRLEEEVGANEAMIETSPSGIIIIDEHGVIGGFNAVAEAMFGYASAEVIGRNVKMLMPEGVGRHHDGFLSAYAKTGEGRIIGVGREVEALRKDGSIFPIHLAVGVTRTSQETRYVGIITDISQRLAAEAELREHRDHLEKLVDTATAEVRAIVQTAASGILTIDEQGIIQLFNPAAERMFGRTRESVIGRDPSLLIADWDRLFRREAFAFPSRAEEGEVTGHTSEVVALRGDGGLFPAHLAVGQVRPSNGSGLFVVFVTDISDMKAGEEKLREALIAAEDGARAKAAFIANMSHEIRTPMNVILGFLDLIQMDRGLSLQTRKHVDTVIASARSLLGIINDVLDVSKLESGKFSLEVVDFHLPGMLREIRTSFGQKVRENGLSFSFDYHVSLPDWVSGDPTRLKQVLLNLIGNAIKFTETGGITVTVKAGEAPGMIAFVIADTGIGMTEKQKAEIFNAFSQADVSTTRRFGGTGLGTTISKQIVELMGGEIWADSRPGEGTTFHFTAFLPEARDAGEAIFEIIGEDYISPRRFRILLAEDLEENATLAILRLEDQGHVVTWVKNGQEAVEATLSSDFDVVLMDVMMPVLDGLDATRAIRERERAFGGALPILALTASVLREEREQCLAAGMDDVVAKPVDFPGLLRTLEQVVPKNPAMGGARPAPRALGTGESRDLSFLDGVADRGRALRAWKRPDAYLGALRSFAAKHAGDAEEMERFLDQYPEDNEPARRVAHGLVGLAGNLALPRIEETARRVDTDLKEEGRREQVRAMLPDLRARLGEVAVIMARVVDPEKAP